MSANFPWYDWAVLGVCLGLVLYLIISVQRRPKVKEEERWLPTEVARDIEALVLQYGEDAVQVELGARALHGFPSLGLFFESSSDLEVKVRTTVCQARYKLLDNYKIGFDPVEQGGRYFQPRALYLGDFRILVHQGLIRVRLVSSVTTSDSLLYSPTTGG